MSQKLLLPTSPLQLLILQVLLLGFAAAYPYVLLPASNDRHLVKRAFDRFDNSGVFSFGAKRFDRYDEDSYANEDYGHIFKRSVDPYRFVALPAKKAFDRMDNSDFFKRKRSFDRIGGTEFGLMKRSGASEDRDQLIDNLAESIIALRRAKDQGKETGSQPVMVTYED